jgi:hypothetical protein
MNLKRKASGNIRGALKKWWKEGVRLRRYGHYWEYRPTARQQLKEGAKVLEIHVPGTPEDSKIFVSSSGQVRSSRDRIAWSYGGITDDNMYHRMSFNRSKNGFKQFHIRVHQLVSFCVPELVGGYDGEIRKLVDSVSGDLDKFCALFRLPGAKLAINHKTHDKKILELKGIASNDVSNLEFVWPARNHELAQLSRFGKVRKGNGQLYSIMLDTGDEDTYDSSFGIECMGSLSNVVSYFHPRFLGMTSKERRASGFENIVHSLKVRFRTSDVIVYNNERIRKWADRLAPKCAEYRVEVSFEGTTITFNRANGAFMNRNTKVFTLGYKDGEGYRRWKNASGKSFKVHRILALTLLRTELEAKMKETEWVTNSENSRI